MLAGVKTGGRVLVVARTMFHLLNKTEAIKSAMLGGARLELVCVDPSNIDETLAAISFIKTSEIKTPLEVLGDLCKWAEGTQPPGILELRASRQPLPDSFVLVELEERDMVVWDLSFGRDLTHKRVLVLEPAKGNLGANLIERYETIFSGARQLLKIDRNGTVAADELQKVIEMCK